MKYEVSNEKQEMDEQVPAWFLVRPIFEILSNKVLIYNVHIPHANSYTLRAFVPKPAIYSQYAV